MFTRRLTSRDGGFLRLITLRHDMEERPVSPCSVMSTDSVMPSISPIRRRQAVPAAFSARNHESECESDCESIHTAATNHTVDRTQSPTGLGRLLSLFPPRSLRTRRWTDSDVIREWADTATELPSSDEPPQPQTQSGGEQRRSSDSFQSHPPRNNSPGNNSPGSNLPRKSQDALAHLKYLVRGFLRQSRADTTTSERKKSSSDKESFVPSPMVTFLIDEPDDLICQICQRTPLKMAITAAIPAPEMMAMLPCGHISCHRCISIWLANNSSCPFCRTDLAYKSCCHQVRPRLIAQDTIHTLPKTLTKGGTIAERCFGCAQKAQREASLKRWAILAEDFQTARCEAGIRGTAEAEEKMQQAQKAFEQLPEDDYWALTNIRHHQW
ncbi:hypothetical protein GGR50DRAFT_697594 [Xylaria sp. CBS 124048]|nr:hypothetical protein GGR50DRAFT_697594 [Xylaria sp. CBS 124048]